jgi:dTDP-4-amino-4,6-dideoxygalactose transaminase
MNFYRKKYNLQNDKLINSYQWGEETLSLPLFPDMTNQEQEYVVKILLEQVEPMVGV